MRPYLAIIKDSFRAAWASKVLYVLLGLITLLLLLVAPFHYRQSIDWKLVPEDYFGQSPAIVHRLMDNDSDAGNISKQNKLIQQIWVGLPEGLRNELTELTEQVGPAVDDEDAIPNKRSLDALGELIGELNLLIADPDAFSDIDPAAYDFDKAIVTRFRQVRESEDRDGKRRVNRLIVAELFSPFVEAGTTPRMTAWYGPYRLSFLDRFVSSKAQFASGIAAYIPGILDKFVLSIGLAIAIVVTASLIPETFEPGSLNLLLSKPISRWGLFLAKFVGGCVYISICATYLFTGVWLWLGLALGVWEHAILLSIILYIIVFGIYFSVSALVGLVYRSTVLAIMVTLVFWGACFLVGTSHGFLDTRLQNTRIVKLAQTNDMIFSLDRMSRVALWHPGVQQWVSPYSADEGGKDRVAQTTSSWFGSMESFPLPFGPSVNPDDQRLIAGRTTGNMFSFGQQELYASSPGGGSLQSEGNFPRGTVDFLQGPDGLIAVTGEGKLFRYGSARAGQGEVESAEDGESKDEDATAKKKIDKKKQAQSDSPLFVSLGPDRPTPVFNRGACAINHTTDEIAIYSSRIISVYVRGDGGYQFDRSIEVETDVPDSMSGLLAFEGETLLLALGNGQLISFDRETLAEEFGYRPETNHAIENLVASSDGRWFFASYRNGYAWVLDQNSPEQMSLAKFAGQGSISAIALSESDEVLVADRGRQVTRYRLPDFEPDDTFRAQDSNAEAIYYWIVRPLYSVWPKPGEFYKVVTWIAQSNEGETINDLDLRLKSRYRNPWAPLRSGLAFMAVMLLLSCVYFWRKDY